MWLAQRRGYEDVRVSRALVMRRYHGSVSLLDTLVYRLRLLRVRASCLPGSVSWTVLSPHIEESRKAGLLNLSPVILPRAPHAGVIARTGGRLPGNVVMLTDYKRYAGRRSPGDGLSSCSERGCSIVTCSYAWYLAEPSMSVPAQA